MNVEDTESKTTPTAKKFRFVLNTRFAEGAHVREVVFALGATKQSLTFDKLATELEAVAAVEQWLSEHDKSLGESNVLDSFATEDGFKYEIGTRALSSSSTRLNTRFAH